MTALNEQRHLAEAVASVFKQDYPGPLELVVAVGPSHDGTEQLARDLAHTYGARMRVLDNPTGRTPHGLNLAIAATDPTTPIIVRTDGHAQLPPAYVRTAVAALQRTGADNVGGMMIPEGTTPFEQAVARAMSSPLGIGSVPFHTGGEPGPAQTVYLGVFRRSTLQRAGGFDERFVRAQDWELNHRIRDLGGVVWFEPDLRVAYRPRPNPRRLATQFRGSGQWRWQIIRTYPETASARYLAPPAAVGAMTLAGAAVLVDLALLHTGTLAVVAALVPGGYLALVLVGALVTGRGLSARALAAYPIAIVTMHVAWGLGFLRGIVTDGLRALIPARPRKASTA
jgi:GT2 family glycosyltransferase